MPVAYTGDVHWLITGPQRLLQLDSRDKVEQDRAKRDISLSSLDDFYERATRNHAKIDRWLARWPNARWAIITGVESGGVALDIDRKCNADGKVIAWGLESLHRAGIIYPSAATPTARTPRGGFRQLFRHPGTFVKSGTLVIDGQEIAGIEVKGDGPSGHCIVAGRGYEWQPYYPLTLALAPCPPWMIMADDRHHAAPSAPVAPVGKLSLLRDCTPQCP